MDYLKEIQNKIIEFCSNVPEKGFEINYLESAKELYNLYGETLQVVENDEDFSKLQKIYEKINKIV